MARSSAYHFFIYFLKLLKNERLARCFLSLVGVLCVLFMYDNKQRVCDELTVISIRQEQTRRR